MRKPGYYYFSLLFVFCFIILCGCASLSEGFKGLAGVSTKVLEDNRQSAIAKTFNYGYFECYTKTLDILNDIGAYIYAGNIKKHMLAIYVSETDTTPVGIFFKEISGTKTEIEVSSASTYAKELISKKIFENLKSIK